MRHGKLAKKGTYAGTGAGIILFLLVGIFPGSLIGGAVGMFISKLAMGGEPVSSLIPRFITALSMAAGIMVTATIFIMGMSTIGWAAGTVIDMVRQPSAEQETKESTSS